MSNEEKREKAPILSDRSVIVIVIGLVVIACIICVTVFLTKSKEYSKKIAELETEIAELKGDSSGEEWGTEGDEEIELETEEWEDYELADESKLGNFYSFTIDGSTFSLPLAFSEFAEKGYLFDENPKEYEIEGKTSHSEFFYAADDKEKNNVLGCVEVYNSGEDAVKEKDGIIVEVEIYQEMDFALENGISFRTTQEQANELLGATSFSNDEDGEISDVWLLDENGYNAITLGYSEGVVSDIKIDYTGDLDYEYAPEGMEIEA